MQAKSYRLTQIHCSGSPTAMGYSLGEQLRASIHRFVDQRFEALAVYMAERQQVDIDGFMRAGRECLQVSEAWHPEGVAELRSIAAAANVDPVRLYAAGNMTDVRDIVLLSPADHSAEDEGCSALVLPQALSQNHEVIAAQTWDLNPGDIDFVVAVHRKPDQGPETWSITCVGCLSLMGMNETGLCVGTTNIKVRDARPGVGYLSLLHRALTSTSREDARLAIREAPRAAAHTYWLADAAGAVELECSAQQVTERRLGEGPLTRTNHCIAPQLRSLQGEPTSPSSQQRLLRLNERLAQGGQTVESIRQLFSDRGDGLLSINRYLEDDTGTSTNACMIAVPGRRSLWACQGPADRGDWEKLSFG